MRLHELDYNPALEPDTLPLVGTTFSAIINMPKVDLHRHLVGAIRPEVLVYIANKIGITIPEFNNDAERIRKVSVITSPMVDGYKHFLLKRIWKAFQPIFADPRGTANAIYWAIADANKDNVCYVEFRVSPYGIHPYFPQNLYKFIDSLKDGIKVGERDFPQTIVKIILSIGRRSVIERWPEHEHSRYYDRLVTVAKAYPDIIVGFDLSGDEDKYPNRRFIEFAKRVKENNFKLTVHAGETDVASSVWHAVKLLRADRIGHGIGAKNDPSLLKMLADREIPLEICPTSNWLLGVVPSIAEHPCKEFMKQNIKVTINTDDPTLLGPTTLSEEFHRLVIAGQITLDDIGMICRNSISASFATEKEKAALVSKVNNHFFVEEKATVAMG